MEKELTLGKIVIDEDILERVMRKVMREIASEQANVVSNKINSSMTVDMSGEAELNRSRKSDDISKYSESSKMDRPAGFQMAVQDRRTTREYEELKESYKALKEKYVH